MKTDWLREYEFFDPHPVTTEEDEELPEDVRHVAESLAGRVVLLSDAIAAIQEVAPDDTVVRAQNDCITLAVGEVPFHNTMMPRHIFTVIRFRPAKKGA